MLHATYFGTLEFVYEMFTIVSVFVCVVCVCVCVCFAFIRCLVILGCSGLFGAFPYHYSIFQPPRVIFGIGGFKGDWIRELRRVHWGIKRKNETPPRSEKQYIYI